MLLYLASSVYNMCFFYVQCLSQVEPEFSGAHSKFTKASNAYMLVYIRKADMDNIMCNTDEQYMAGPLWVRFLFAQFTGT